MPHRRVIALVPGFGGRFAGGLTYRPLRSAFYIGARVIAGCLGFNHKAILHDF